MSNVIRARSRDGGRLRTGRVAEIELWDGRWWPGRIVDGLPAFEFRRSPSGLVTRRQLRDKGLSPGGQEPFARLVWRGDRCWAWLYVEAYARPKRVASPAQLEAIEKALAARMVCASCGPVEYCVRTTDQLCGDCYLAGATPGENAGTTGWQVLHQWLSTTHAVDTADAADAVQQAEDAVARCKQRSAAAVVRDSRDDGNDWIHDQELTRRHADDAAARNAAGSQLLAERTPL